MIYSTHIIVVSRCICRAPARDAGEVKSYQHVRRSNRVGFGDASSILADIPVAIGRFADKRALLYATHQALANIDGLLLGVEARHVGERAPHNSADGVVVGRL